MIFLEGVIAGIGSGDGGFLVLGLVLAGESESVSIFEVKGWEFEFVGGLPVSEADDVF